MVRYLHLSDSEFGVSRACHHPISALRPRVVNGSLICCVDHHQRIAVWQGSFPRITEAGVAVKKFVVDDRVCGEASSSVANTEKRKECDDNERTFTSWGS